MSLIALSCTLVSETIYYQHCAACGPTPGIINEVKCSLVLKLFLIFIIIHTRNYGNHLTVSLPRHYPCLSHCSLLTVLYRQCLSLSSAMHA